MKRSIQRGLSEPTGTPRSAPSHLGRPESPTKALPFRPNRAMNDRQPEDVLAGLPVEVMDGLVEDLADAVVAMLLNPNTAAADKRDDESRDLRTI